MNSYRKIKLSSKFVVKITNHQENRLLALEDLVMQVPSKDNEKPIRSLTL